jgi:predicted NAD-dependent protein-ADP-ribosyltransferase YbiA (DUF1768 family)
MSDLLAKDATLHQYFGSGAGIGELSNFAAAQVRVRDRAFPSSEHAYQCMAKVHQDDWKRFEVGGDLSTLKTGLKLIFPVRDYPKKLKHYSAKGTRPQMVGIVALQAVKPGIARKLGLRLQPVMESDKWKPFIETLFNVILLAKYRQNPGHCAKLLGTGNKPLVEFSRGAEREAKKGKPPLWTGIVVGGEKQENGVVAGGSVVGQNLMGRLHMKAREELRRAGGLF